jgi:hypothetical protein
MLTATYGSKARASHATVLLSIGIRASWFIAGRWG